MEYDKSGRIQLSTSILLESVVLGTRERSRRITISRRGLLTTYLVAHLPQHPYKQQVRMDIIWGCCSSSRRDAPCVPMLPTHLGDADKVVDDAEFPGDRNVIGEVIEVVRFKPGRLSGADHR